MLVVPRFEQQFAADAIRILSEDAIKSGSLKEGQRWLWDDLQHISFPMTFGSTAGPFGGIGGQMMTTFRMDVLQSPDGKTAVFAGGGFWKMVDRFEFRHNLTTK